MVRDPNHAMTFPHFLQTKLWKGRQCLGEMFNLFISFYLSTANVCARIMLWTVSQEVC